MKQTVIVAILLSMFTSCEVDNTKEFEVVRGQENSIWSESIYLRGFKPSTGQRLTAKHLEIYANTLKENRIKYAYLFSGPYDTSGHLPDYAFSDTAVNSVRVLKQINPELVILPWLGGVQNKTVYLGDSMWVENALNDTERLVQTLDIPGVHIDFEYILAGDPYLDQEINKEKPGDLLEYGPNVNSFHKKLRQRLPNSFISSVVVATSSGTKPWKRKTSIPELDTLCRHIDQISFLYYDTHISENQKFIRNCEELVFDINHLKNRHKEVQFLVAIGTFVNVPQLHKYRNLEIESIENTLQTIKGAISKVESSEIVVDGIAIFCDWHTDKYELEEFYSNWVKTN